MCGICGILSFSQSESGLAEMAESMVGTIKHRGPDGQGIYSDDSGIGLGHARLSIIDLSELGKQPMHSSCGRYVISYNGEIYNFKSLAEKLEKAGIRLRGDSDTEVLLEGIALWGLEATLAKISGMFAIALWDRQDKKLSLARDRFGEKPLYYGLIKGQFVFASEIRAFRKHPDFSLNINRQALSAYVKYNYIPSPLCILDGFYKLPSATYISGCTPQQLIQEEPKKFWNCYDDSKKVECSIDGFEDLLTRVVDNQMISDVPLGSFLSGGIDSSLITAIAQSISDRPIDTFTIGFKEKEFDESEFASKVARHLGTNHKEWVITQKDILDMVPTVGAMYDEPFGDSSQLPTALLSRMTRQEVTVCLSGDGGDELFGGYSRYDWALKLERWLGRIPKPVQKSFQWLYSKRELEDWERTYQFFDRFLPLNFSHFGDKLEKLNSIVGQSEQEGLYEILLTHWHFPERLVVGGSDYSTVKGSFNPNLSFIENMMMHDARHYLVDDIMVKVDRAAMASSLESRAPFLDHRLFEAAWSMPIEIRRKGGMPKYPLKEILYKYVPQEIIDRPKKGFGVPLAKWFREDLSDWVQDKLDYKLIKDQGYFNSDVVKMNLDEHMSGASDRHYHLWDILVFQEWLDNWNS